MAKIACRDSAWVDRPPPEAMPAAPPTQDDLPCDDGEPLETQRHKWQMGILIDAMDLWLGHRGEGYVNGNMFVYFNLQQTRGKYFRGPDVFVVLGVPRGERKSWVVWEQGKAPDVIIELLSENTAAHDKGDKKQIYQDLMRVPEYFWVDPFNPEDRAGFHLFDGTYRPIQRDERGALASPLLGLCLLLWEGTYRGLQGTWLRWAMPDSTLLPTDAEAAHREADQQRERADAAQGQAEEQKRRADEESRSAADARQQIDSERSRAERAEAEVARLRALLESGVRS